jgi:hypothetical protein
MRTTCGHITMVMNRPQTTVVPYHRTAVQQRPHQETGRVQVATSEPVVLHHGREGGRRSSRRGAAGCCNSLLAGALVVESGFRSTLNSSPDFVSHTQTSEHAKGALKIGVFESALFDPRDERRAILGEKVFKGTGREKTDRIIGRSAFDHLDKEFPGELG